MRNVRFKSDRRRFWEELRQMRCARQGFGLTFQRMESDQGPGRQPLEEDDFVWSYRGYHLKASEFTTAIIHFFRAEVTRANIWRQRLDATTNWAVITTGAAISFVFSRSEAQPTMLLLNMALVSLFLSIEARRYRYYELWSYRVRLIETDFYAAMLVPPFKPARDWAETLAENLLHPSFPISKLEAFGRRLRRNYAWIYLVLLLTWGYQLWLPFKSQAFSWLAFTRGAAVGPIPGGWILGAVALFHLALSALGILTMPLQEATGEVLPRFHTLGNSRGTGKPGLSASLKAWFRPSRRRQLLLTLIITDKAVEVSEKIFSEMNRGVTKLEGTGMYTERPHPVLMCAVTITEIPQLKDLVREADAEAFVIVSPAEEVFGSGFRPIEEDE